MVKLLQHHIELMYNRFSAGCRNWSALQSAIGKEDNMVMVEEYQALVYIG